MKKRALVVCPGRGSYGKEELGYIVRTSFKVPFEQEIRNIRKQMNQPCLFDLDSRSEFSIKDHLSGENAAGLIYLSSYIDFQLIDREEYEIVAITGNSMGWYSALSISKVLSGVDGFILANQMGSMMRDGNIGTQIIYPVCDENWNDDHLKIKKLSDVLSKLENHESARAYLSINFGGYRIIGANEEAANILMQELPKVDNVFPLKMSAHAAFHTPLLESVSNEARSIFRSNIFNKPTTSLVDGRGVIWQPYSTDVDELYNYTLNHQVVKTYDFTAAISVGLKEFAPDKVILLGPGHTTGGAIAQIMISLGWKGLKNKNDFIKLQDEEPILLAMGRSEQRAKVISK